jgi:hypothetical protein
MAERIPEWQALGFSSPEAYEDAKAASEEMLKIEYLMGVQDKLPEGYKMNQGPGKPCLLRLDYTVTKQITHNSANLQT